MRLTGRNTTNYLLLGAVLTLLAAFLIYPIWLTLRGAFSADPATHDGFTLRHIALVFKDPVLLEGLLNAFKVATCTTLLAIAIALPLAVLSAKYTFPLKGVFNALILIPLILPPFVGAIGIKLMLGREGAVNTLLGTEVDFFSGRLFGAWFDTHVISTRLLMVAVMQALSLYPIIFLNATAALANLDPAIDESAQNVGAGFWRRLFKITLPLIRPGLFAGGTIVFIWAFTELGTPLVFDFQRVTPVQIFNGLKEVEASSQPYALTLIMLTAALGIYVLGKMVFGGRAHAMYAKASRAASLHSLTGWRGLLATAAFAAVIGLAVLPHLGVLLAAISSPGSWYQSILPESFTLGNLRQALTSDMASSSINNSLLLASCAVLLDLGIGIIVGYLIVRTNIRGRGLLDALCMLPLAVPGLVMAFGYVAMSLAWPFGKGDPLEGWVSVLAAEPNPIPLLIIAYAVRRLPYIVRATVAGLEQTSGQMEEAALNLGASRLTAVRRIIIPLIAANLIAGALLAFSFAMLEVSDSLILAQQERHYPITKAIFTFTGRLADGPYIASALGLWGMALLAVTLVGASVLMGKKLGAIFRV